MSMTQTEKAMYADAVWLVKTLEAMYADAVWLVKTLEAMRKAATAESVRDLNGAVAEMRATLKAYEEVR